MLLNDEALENSSVVANCAMNRERGLSGRDGYDRLLGLDIVSELVGRLDSSADSVGWLDMCCGSANALRQAAELLAAKGCGDRVAITGVDLVGHFGTTSRMVELVTASVTSWAPRPGRPFDLVTCVHGLHYVGDKLQVLRQAASWLTPDGIFIGSFDMNAIRMADGSAAGRRLAAILKQAGFDYDARRRRIGCRGARSVELPLRYLGADDTAGPNYTGQPAVYSYYEWA